MTNGNGNAFLNHVGNAFGTAAGGIVSALVAFTILAKCGPGISESLRGASCADPRGLESAEEPEVKATSSLKPQDSFTYEPKNTVDGDTGTAWVEGAPGLGKGEKVTFTWTEPQNVRLICIVNGYGRSWDRYTANARLRLANVTTDAEDAEESALIEQNDNSFAEFQELDAPEGKTSSVVIEIIAVRAGRDTDLKATRDSDTAISEIEFWVDE